MTRASIFRFARGRRRSTSAADGLIYLIAGSAGPRDRNDSKDIAISLCLRYRDENCALRLRAPVALKDSSGSEFLTPIPYHHGLRSHRPGKGRRPRYKAIDWDKDGQLDLIAGGESGWVYYFPRAVLRS